MSLQFEYVLNLNRKFVKKSFSPQLELKEDEVRVIPKLIGICGSDLYHYSQTGHSELFLGHEWIGEVSEVGRGVTQLIPGDAVTSSSTLGCGSCDFCQKGIVNLCRHPMHLGSDRIGALRSQLVMKSFNALKLKSNESSEALIEVMAVAVEAVRLMKENLKGQPENVLVMGAGTVGLLIAYLLKEEHIPVIVTDITAERVERAKSLHIQAWSLKQLLFQHGNKESFDVLFDVTSDREGNKGGWDYIPALIKKAGLCIMVGKYIRNVTITPDLFSRLALRMVFMRGLPLSSLGKTIDQWSGRLGPIAEKIMTHRFSSEELGKAFETALDTRKSGKVVIEMP